MTANQDSKGEKRYIEPENNTDMKKHTQNFRTFSLNEDFTRIESNNMSTQIFNDAVQDDITRTKFLDLIYSLGLAKDWSQLRSKILDALRDRIESGDLDGFVATGTGNVDAEGAIAYIIKNRDDIREVPVR